MLKIKTNGFIEVMNSLDDNLDGINELVFSYNELSKLDVLNSLKFKHRKFNEFVFNELSIYKLHAENEEFVITKLTEYQISYFNNMVEICKLIPIDINVDSYDEIIVKNNTDNIIYEDDNIILSTSFVDNGDCVVKILRVTQKKDEKNKKNEYDYAEYHKSKKIKKVINNLFVFSPEHNSFIVESKKHFLPIDTKKIEEYMYNNFEQIEAKTDLEDIQINIFTKNEVDEFAKIATRNEYSIEHSWAGEQYNEVEFETLLGDISYGVDALYEYSANGNIGTPEINKKLPDFKMDSNIIFIRKDYSFDSLSGNRDTEYFNTEYTIVVYMGTAN